MRSILFLAITSAVLAMPAQSAPLRLDFEGTVDRLFGVFDTVRDPDGSVPRVSGSLYLDTGFVDTGGSLGNDSILSASSDQLPLLNAAWGVDIRFGSLERSTRINLNPLGRVHHILGVFDNSSPAEDGLFYGTSRNVNSDNGALISIIGPDLVSAGDQGAGDAVTFELLERIARNLNNFGPSDSISNLSSFDSSNPDGTLEGFIVFRIDTLRVVDLGGSDNGPDLSAVPLPAGMVLLLSGLFLLPLSRRVAQRGVR